jgi:hypothetical protein
MLSYISSNEEWVVQWEYAPILPKKKKNPNNSKKPLLYILLPRCASQSSFFCNFGVRKHIMTLVLKMFNVVARCSAHDLRAASKDVTLELSELELITILHQRIIKQNHLPFCYLHYIFVL